MKTILILIVSLFSIVKSSFAQEQFVSESINYDIYEDASYKVFLQSSSAYEFPMIITWNYETSSILFMASDGTEWLSATWKTEVNPDNITGDENNRFLFDPAKNELKMKVLKIYVNDNGTFTYKIEADKQKIEIYGVQSDDNANGLGDITEASEAEGSEMNSEDVGDYEEAPMYYLNLSNTTEYTIYISTNIENTSGQWTLAKEWISIPAGESYMIGNTYSDHFYYYAYCKDSKGEFIIWEGTDQYHQVGDSEKSYGFRHVGLSDGAFDDDGEVWFMDLSL